MEQDWYLMRLSRNLRVWAGPMEMLRAGISGKSRGQMANPGSSGKITIKTACVTRSYQLENFKNHNKFRETRLQEWNAQHINIYLT